MMRSYRELKAVPLLRSGSGETRSSRARSKGYIPAERGAGYAGGIMSAAMDGIKIAEMIAKQYAPVK